ncbi:ATP-dependent DNA helicase UvrD2 [Vallicoccus soli]|nr:ATP-dependent DNA helicase UvrD2 [Vallicoccus soli]
MSTPSADDVLAALDPEQREVALALRGPVRVLAGAGTGKTRAITHRIAYGVHAGVLPARQVLAVTFTARAAGEMRTRLRMLGVPGVQARTFHAAALRQLQFFWPRAVGGELPRLVDHKASLVAEAAARQRLRLDRTGVRDLAAEVEWLKVTMTPRDEYAAAAARAGRVPPDGLDAATVARVVAAYEELKRDRALMDFEDVLVYAVGLLADRPDVARAVREQYAHFVVDEYQDVSPLQQALLDLWVGDRDDVCVVGDPSQTIYSFTGATPEHLLGFTARYPRATEVRLVRDYRSTPQVVGLANALLQRVPASARQTRLRLVAQRPDGPSARFTEHPDDPAEATGVAHAVAALLATGVRASEVAVLFRTNGQSEAVEQALSDAGIPYVLRGGERFFQRREVREAHLLLRGAARAGEGSEGSLPEEARAVLAGTGWDPSSPPGGGAARERWESLQALAALADDLAAAREGATLADLVAELDERAAAQHAPTVEGVTLASLHAAKGLEWDAVFLVGLSEGLLPISYADTPDAVEEERRLLYVGVTRAREHLALSWSLARTPGGRGSRKPSRFLDGLRPAGGSARDGAPAGGGGRTRRAAGPVTCRTCGKTLSDAVARKLGRCADCPSTYDEELYERLREWRREQAQSQSVPAYVVFTDATLTAIAEARPGSSPELARIPGVGRTKLDKYAEDVLALVAGEATVGEHA